ncbi:MAG: DUF2721 domain-containing protein [Bacteroidales bacterium]|nr:DUF2721 domain-containing protein [Bacteroidales bacterium]
MIEIIQAMLAPAIMISACGLLLLGMNNKYSLVINRIRTLNVEYRGLDEDSHERKSCIHAQLPLLENRMRMIKNTVWLYTVGIAMFIFTILSIGLFIYFDLDILSMIAMLVFVGGMLSVLVGVFYAAHEVRLGYKILEIELVSTRS